MSIHQRKPLSVESANAKIWLRDGMDKGELIDAAVKAETFKFFSVHKAVGDPRNDGESLISPLP
jgi:putative SOS response-associated peptidase YedK